MKQKIFVGQNDGQNDGQNVGQNDGESEWQNVTKNVTQNVTQSDKLKPVDRHKKIVEIIRTNSKITASELSKQFNVTERTIKRDLKVLTDEKIIEYVGSARDGYWKVYK
ncbi:HTH domain-containing protein [Neofamilia massiliensis]|uniref:HTH domain-containing protein n=1 Tax=Neofamilia massiliensis TaxID=1673724 RepID=UPI0006BB5F99|nr:HTH domain-containing protein [Neofamilia massiliensis]